eukprot:5612076-Ditylum_brightwellii.AAC.1
MRLSFPMGVTALSAVKGSKAMYSESAQVELPGQQLVLKRGLDELESDGVIERLWKEEGHCVDNDHYISSIGGLTCEEIAGIGLLCDGLEKVGFSAAEKDEIMLNCPQSCNVPECGHGDQRCVLVSSVFVDMLKLEIGSHEDYC